MVASAWIYAYTHESDNKEVRERLQQQAMIMATDIRKFKPYQDNTFFFVSTQDGYIIKGALPDGFPNQTVLSLGQVGEIAVGDDIAVLRQQFMIQGRQNTNSLCRNSIGSSASFQQ